MKRILDIGYTDLRLFFKHKSAYVWLFVMPLLFVYFMGFGNRVPARLTIARRPCWSKTRTRIFSAAFFSTN